MIKRVSPVYQQQLKKGIASQLHDQKLMSLRIDKLMWLLIQRVEKNAILLL